MKNFSTDILIMALAIVISVNLVGFYGLQAMREMRPSSCPCVECTCDGCECGAE